LYIGNDPNIQVSVADNATLFTNEHIQNEGIVTLNNLSRFVFDGDFENNGTINYQNASAKGILEIGSGESTSGNAQDIKFNATSTEEAPFVILNKTASTATISRGHVEVLESLVAISGTLNADSEITDTPTANTVTGLTMLSSASSTAVIDESAGGFVNNIIVERHIPISNRAFRAFSSSLTTNGSIRDNLMEGGMVTSIGGTNNPRPGYGTHITGDSGNTNGFDVSNTNNASMFQYSDPNNSTSPYSALADTNGTLSAGESFLVFIRGGRDVDLTNNTAVGSTTTKLRLLGDAHIGNFTHTNALVFQDMPTLASSIDTQYYAAIGNPYHAQVNLEEVLSSSLTTGVDKTQVYVFDPTFGTGNGAWVTLNFTFNGTDYVFNSAVPSATGITSANKYLQPNQAIFFEKDNTTDAVEIRFEETFKKDSDPSTTTSVFSDINDSDFSLRVNLFETSQNDLRDGILLKFNANYSDHFSQQEDALTFVNNLETLATLSEDGKLLSFDKRNINQEGEIVHLSLNNYTASNYKFQIEVENNNNQENIYLIDSYLETTYPIDNNTFIHNFTVDTNIPASIASDRFSLVFDNTTLGVAETTFGYNFSLYPNPAQNGRFYVTTPGLSGEAQVTLTNILGQQVYAQQLDIQNQEVQIHADNLSSGVYMMNLSQGEQSFSTKVIIE
jgi:hypothetical protein